MIDRFTRSGRRAARIGSGSADADGGRGAERDGEDRVPERYDSIDFDDGTVVVYDREHPPSWIQSANTVRLDEMV